MSRHHILPPIVYTPQPKPKKIENRRAKGVQKRDAASASGAGTTEETDETTEFARPSGVAAHPASSPFTPIEGAEGRTQQGAGKLSESTLKTLLVAQEIENAHPADGTTAKKG
jgi:hypothetical protein